MLNNSTRFLFVPERVQRARRDLGAPGTGRGGGKVVRSRPQCTAGPRSSPYHLREAAG